ncbi:DUF5693 family protein [Carboxydothermus ferrireducens]|uniref:Uncharacterized protein n=1 Tax=Carboxydothermus ferrireducens DSM 11255 TaxID=1119529 RepID=A0ABX2R920_9THEO|nr:DUF5693 family protein [Carboxydothermus ferrireducens]NYE57679.1 hypothetical protein [Carboxydothermus ferrireducens DSM 11255]
MKKGKILLAILLLVIFAFSIILLPPRIAEDKKKETGFYLDYETLINLSSYWGLTPEQTIAKLKKTGFVGLALYEENGSSQEIFNQEAGLFSGVSAVATFPEFKDFIELKAPYTYLITDNKEIVDSAIHALSARKIKNQIQQVNKKYILKINYPYKSTEKLLLGFNPQGLEMARKNNLDVLLFIPQWSIANEQEVKNYLSYIKTFCPEPKVVFADKNLPENNKFTKIFADTFLKENFSVGLLDGIDQPQTNAMINRTKLPVFRVRQVTINTIEGGNILATTEEKIESLKIGIRERRNKAIVFKIPAKEFNKTTVLAFETVTSQTYETMKSLNYQFVPVNPLKKIPERKPEKLLLSVLLIILFGYSLVLFDLVNIKTALTFTVILLIGGFALFTLNFDLYFKLCAFGASVLYPLIALFSIDIKNPNSFLKALASLAIVVLIGVFGGFAISAFLTGNNYFVHADLFRGVKLSFLLPVLIFAIYAARVLLVREKSLKQVVFEYLGLELKLWQLFVLIIVFGAGAYYLLRTGNAAESLVLPGEIKLRALLNKYLYVRPRFKEFAIGYPLLLWGLWTKVRPEIRYIALVIGSLAPVTVINTFAHQYDPLWVSLIRTGNGLLLGSILGIFLIAINMVMVKAFLKGSQGEINGGNKNL